MSSHQRSNIRPIIQFIITFRYTISKEKKKILGLVQDTYSNMAASEKFIRDGSISVVFMSDAREVT
jgi:hypothetical protein